MAIPVTVHDELPLGSPPNDRVGHPSYHHRAMDFRQEWSIIQIGKKLMIGRARRLKEIAEANTSAFASNTGTEWWLAEAPTQYEPSKAVAPAKPLDACRLESGTASLRGAEVENTPDSEPVALAAGSAPTYAFESVSPVQSRKADRDAVTWDPKACCFVSMA